MFARLRQWLQRLFAPPAPAPPPSDPPLRPLMRQELRWVTAEASMIDRVLEDMLDVTPSSTEGLDSGVWFVLATARPRGYRIPDPAFVRFLAMEAAARTLGLVMPLPDDGVYRLPWHPVTGALPEIIRQEWAQTTNGRPRRTTPPQAEH